MSDPTLNPTPEPHEPAQDDTGLRDPVTLDPTARQTPQATPDGPDVDDEDVHAIEAVRTDPALRAAQRDASADAPGEADARMRVQWVRPTDLAARAGARVLERGAELNRAGAHYARQAALEAGRDGLGKLRRALAARERSLTPDAPITAVAPVLGRQGVSR